MYNLLALNKSYFFLLLLGAYFTGHQSYAQDFTSYEQKIETLNLSFTMEAIPGGEFMMGNDKSSYEDEKPAHQVKIDSFYMSTYEVTWDLYEPFVYKDYETEHSSENAVPDNVDAVTRPTKPYLDMTFGMGKKGFPAVGMTQYNAIQFCKWLYEYTGVFYRLPTEAEWEYASRADSQTDYFFGDDPENLEEYAWYEENSDNQTSPVGEKKPNPFGLYDILGNVAEWTYDQYIEDFYQKSTGETVSNPVAEPKELYPHVVRGGSFKDSAEDLTLTRRQYSDPSWKQMDPQIPKSNWWFPEAPFVGIRLVRPLNPPSEQEIEAYYNEEPIKDY